MPTRPRVLLADDHPDIVKAVRRLLASDCDVVGSVADGSALMDEARRLQPDVIVLDLSLPNIHGLDACRQITQLHPRMKVIVFTAMNDPEVRAASLAVGASAFVWKLDAADLSSTIARLCKDQGG